MRLLEEFVEDGPVDVLILSSSMGDTGISAAALSDRWRKGKGKFFRAFNFSLGGADLPTYPVMYRMARLIATPKEVWLVVPMGGPQEEIVPGSLDEQLLKGWVSRYEARGILGLAWQVYKLPMIRFAPALRDGLMNGGFPHRPSTSADFYHVNPFGDTISWVYNAEKYETGARMAIDRRREAGRFSHSTPIERQGVQADYFNSRTVAAIRELRADLHADGVRLKIIAFDHAVGLSMRDAEYLEASRVYFDQLAREFEAPLLDVREDFELMPHMVADPTHLNTMGARAFTDLLAARLEGMTPRRPPRQEVSRRLQTLAPDPGWTPFTALIPKNAEEASQTLQLQYLENWGLPRLQADSRLKLEIRLPDDSDITVPARAMAHGMVVADTSRLPIMDRDVVLRVQLRAPGGGSGEPLPLPLATFRWSRESHAASFYTPEPHGHVESMARTYSVVEPISVRWKGVQDPGRDDWVGVFPVGDDRAARLTYAYLGGASAGTAEMRPPFIPGRYELRLVRANGWDILGVSEPFEVVDMTGAVRVQRSKAASGETLHVQWADLSHPHPKDWVGLFAKGAQKPIVFAQTLGRRTGEAWLKAPANARPGEYEIRLCTGGWRVIARTAVNPPGTD